MGFGKDVQAVNPYTATDGAFNAALGIQREAIETTAQGYYDQARIVAQESRRQAELVARGARELVDANSLQYSSSGVRADQGSPIAVASEIAKRAKQDVDAYINQGLAQAQQYRQQAYLTRTQGRASLLGQYIDYSTGKMSAGLGAIKPSGFGNTLGAGLTALSGAMFSKAINTGGTSSLTNNFIVNPLKSLYQQLNP